MSQSNNSLLRRMAARISKAMGLSKSKKASSESEKKKLERHLALDNLEDRLLLSVTADTTYDVVVNTTYGDDQATATVGNAVASDDDGDVVVAWTRGDRIYYHSGDTITITEDDVEYTVLEGDVGLITEDGTLVRLFTEEDIIKYGPKVVVSLDETVLRGSTTEAIIWNFLYDKLKNAYGAAGLMGNLFAESGLQSNNLENSYASKWGTTDEAYTAAVDAGTWKNPDGKDFVHDSAGYGLAQWTYYTRKEKLYNYCKSKGTSIADVGMQLEYLFQELSTGYSGVLNTLKYASSVLEASNAVLLQFERPANQGTAVQATRASYGQSYYDKYAAASESASETEEEEDDEDSDSTKLQLKEYIDPSTGEQLVDYNVYARYLTDETQRLMIDVSEVFADAISMDNLEVAAADTQEIELDLSSTKNYINGLNISVMFRGWFEVGSLKETFDYVVNGDEATNSENIQVALKKILTDYYKTNIDLSVTYNSKSNKYVIKINTKIASASSVKLTMQAGSVQTITVPEISSPGVRLMTVYYENWGYDPVTETYQPTVYCESYVYKQLTAAEDLQEKLEEIFGKGNVSVTMPNGDNEFLVIFSTTGTFAEIGTVKLDISIQSVNVDVTTDIDESAGETTVDLVFPQDLTDGVYQGVLSCIMNKGTSEEVVIEGEQFMYMVADWEAEGATDLNLDNLRNLFNNALDPEAKDIVIDVYKTIVEENIVYRVELATTYMSDLKMELEGGDYETRTRVGKSANLNSFVLSTGGKCTQKVTFSSVQKYPADDPTTGGTTTGKASISVAVEVSYKIDGETKKAKFNYTEVESDGASVLQTYRNAAVMQAALEEIFGEDKVTVSPISACEFQIEFEPTVDDGADTLLEMSITKTAAGQAPGILVEWLRHPVLTSPIGLVYNDDGSIDMGGTAANIEKAFNATSINLLEQTVQGRTVNDDAENHVDNDIEYWEAQKKTQRDLINLVGDKDFSSPDLVSQSTLQVTVTPVMNIGTGIIGFDITFTGSSGLQDVPEVSVSTITAVAKEEYYTRLQSKTIIFNTTKYNTVLTLKQSSGEFRVNSLTDDSFNWRTGVYHATKQSSASVAIDADGDFVITWTSETPNARIPGSQYDVYARTYSASMLQTPFGELDPAKELEDDEPLSERFAPSVELHDMMGFYATSDPFMVNTSTTGPQYNSSVAMDNDGNFVVVWASKAQTQSYFNGVYMQVYDNHGNRVGNEVRVDVERTWEATNPVVAMSPDGSCIVVAWEWAPDTNQDNNQVYYNVYSLSLDNGVTLVSGFNSLGVAGGHDPSITFNYSNQFAIALEQSKKVSDTARINQQKVFMTQLQWDASTKSISTLRGLTQVSYATGSQYGAAVAMDADGDIVVAYNGKGIDATLNVNITTEMMTELFGDIINASTNADLRTYFNPLTASILSDDVYTDIDSQSERQLSVWFRSGSAEIETTGDIDGIIIAILANAQKQGASTVQIGRLNAILEDRLGVLRGDSNGALFTVFDANSSDTSRIFRDSIANAKRDGSNSSWTIRSGATIRIETIYGKTENVSISGDVDAVRDQLQNVLTAMLAKSFEIGGEESYVKYSSDQINDMVEVLLVDSDLATSYSGSGWAFAEGWYEIAFQGYFHDMVVGIYTDYENPTDYVKGISYGYEGTEQFSTAVAMETNGSFTMSWSENTTTSAGDTSNQTIYIRHFEESEDSAGPRITDVYYADGTQINSGDQLIDLNIEETLNAMIVVFDEKMLTEYSGSDVSYEKCVTNPENWVLMKDGDVVENAISRVEFGMNRTSDADMQALGMFCLGENKWEAVVIFNDGIDLEDGTYEIVALNSMSDNNGNALNRSGYAENGANSIYTFNVITGSQESQNLTSEQTTSQTFATEGTFSPNSIASDYEGDTVTVWTNDTDIHVNLQYLKWNYEDSVREAVTEGKWTKDFLIETESEGVEFASVAMAGDGNFVVTWSQNDGTEDVPNWTIYAQMFNLNGTAIDDAFQVCTVEESETIYFQQRYSTVAMNNMGEFIITWQSYNQASATSSWDIYAQRYTSAGKAVGLNGDGEEFLVNTTIKNSQLNTSAAIDNSGNFIITWTSFGHTGDGDAAYESNIYMKRYSKTTEGYTVGDETLVNSDFTAGNQKWSNVAMDASGDAVITWTSYGQDGVGSGYGRGANGLNSVHAQRYNNAGAKVGTNFQVNTTEEDNQQLSKVSMSASGDFIIVWESYQGSSTSAEKTWNVYAQRYVSNTELANNPGDYDASGRLGSEFVTYENSTAGDERIPSVAMNSVGDYFVVWQSNENASEYKKVKKTEKKVWDIYRRSTYVANDEIGNVVVRIDGYLDALKFKFDEAMKFTNEDMSFEDNVLTVVMKSDVTTGSGKFTVNVSKDGTDQGAYISKTSVEYDELQEAYICTVTFLTGYTVSEGEFTVSISDTVLYLSETGDLYENKSMSFNGNVMTISMKSEPTTGDGKFSVSITKDGEDQKAYVYDTSIRYDAAEAAYICEITFADDYIIREGEYFVTLADSALTLTQKGTIYKTEVFPVSTATIVETHLNALEVTFGEQMLEDNSSLSVTNLAHWSLTRNGEDITDYIQAVIPVGYRESDSTYNGGYCQKDVYRVVLKNGYVLDSGVYVLSVSEVADIFGNILDGDSDGVSGGMFSYTFTIDTSDVVKEQDVRVVTDDGALIDTTDVTDISAALGFADSGIDATWTVNATASDYDGDTVTVWNDAEGNLWATITYAKWTLDGDRKIDSNHPITTDIQITEGVNARYASVAMSGDGNFVVTWSQNDYQGTSSEYEMDGNGNYVYKFGSKTEPVLKTDWNVYAQLFSLNGEAITDTYLVNTTIDSTQCYSSVSMNMAGDFVIVWQSYDWNTSRGEYDWNVYTQTYSSTGARIGMINEVQSLSFLNDWIGSFKVSFLGQETGRVEYNGNAYSLAKELEVELESLASIVSTEDLTYKFSLSVVSMTEINVTIIVDGDDTARNVELLEIVDPIENGESGGGLGFTEVTPGQGGEQMVNTTINLNQMFATVAMDDTGNYVVSWTADNPNELSKKAAYRTSDVRMRLYRVAEANSTSDEEETEDETLDKLAELTIRGNVDPDEYVTTAKTGVGIITCTAEEGGEEETGTGALLWSGKHVLTAQHIVSEYMNEDGTPKADMTVTFTTDDGEEIIAHVVQISTYGWDGVIGNAGDLAILELDDNYADRVETYNINRSTAQGVGLTFTHYGYGQYGTSQTEFDYQKRVGQNKWETTAAKYYSGQSGTVLMYDFDDGTEENDLFGDDTGLGAVETISLPGDSGGPCFVGSLIYGVTHAIVDANENGITGDPGDAGMDTSVAYYASWIDEVVGSSGSSTARGGSTGAEAGVLTHTAATDEVVVNSEYTAGTQKWSSVAMDADGDITVTWTSNSADEKGKTVSQNNVYAKQYRYNTETSTLDTKKAMYKVNTTVSEVPQFSSVSMDADGDYTIVWSGRELTETEQLVWNVYGQRYVNATKQAAAEVGTYGVNGEKDEEFIVNEQPLTVTELDMDEDGRVDQYVYPAANVAMTHTGDFTVTWQDKIAGKYEVFSRSYLKVNDDTGATVVRVMGRLNGEDVSITEGRLFLSPISNEIDVILGEQVNAETIMKASNWTLSYNGVDVSAKIQAIEKVGYENTSLDYDSGYDEKVVYHVTFSSGTFDQKGNYTLTLKDNVLDQFGNRLDGDKDGISKGDFTVSFVIGEESPIDPEEEVEDHSAKFDDEIPDSVDYRVNTTTEGNQTGADVAMDDNGNYVSVWCTPTEDGSLIMGQRFDRFGNKIGKEFTISDFTNGQQTDPCVAMDSVGRFVVTWTVTVDTAQTQRVFCRVYNMYGEAITDSFAVGIDERLQYQSPGSQFQSSVAIDDNGTQFVVTWSNTADSSTQIYAQRFTRSGEKIGEKFLVSDGDIHNRYAHSVCAMDKVGNLVVVWQNSSATSSGQNIHARKFDSTNEAIGNEFIVNSVTRSTQDDPDVSMNDIGQFIVAWTSGETNKTDVYFQCFDSDLTRIGAETCASATQEEYVAHTDYVDYIDTWQVQPSVAIQRDSENGTSFRLAWTSFGQEYPTSSEKSYGVFTIRYDSLLTMEKTTSVEQRLNGHMEDNEQYAEVAMDAYGNTAIVWIGPEASDGVSTGDTTDVFQRVYTTGEEPPYYVSPTIGAKTQTQSTSGQVVAKPGTNYALVDNGGANVTTEITTTTITGPNETINKFVVSLASGSPRVSLNGASVTLPNTTKTIVYNSTGSDRIFITGSGSETLTADGDSITVTGSGYTFVINGGTTVTVSAVGSAELTAGDDETVTANGADVEYVAGDRTLKLDGCSNISATAVGKAIAYLTGTSAVDAITTGDGVAALAGTGYAVAVKDFAEVYAYGGEGDTLTFANTTAKVAEADGVLTLTTEDAKFTAEGFGSANIATDDLTAVLTGDKAVLDVKGIGTASVASVAFGGYELNGFTDVTLNGGAGDSITLLDSAGKDTLVIDASNNAVMTGNGYSIAANGFEAINALSTAGEDSITLFDTANDDAFDITAAGVTYGGNEISGFKTVKILSQNGGNDTLTVTGTENADFFALNAGDFMAKIGLVDYSAVGFADVNVNGNGGKDVLTAHDSKGDDAFTMTPGSLELTSDGFCFVASNIATIYAYSSNGGADTLTINDTAGDDAAMLRGQYARMTDAAGNAVVASGFKNIALTSVSGSDSVVMYDSYGDDTFNIKANGKVSVEGEDFYNAVAGFRNVKLYATFGGKDTAVYDSIYDALFDGNDASLESDDVEINLLSFESYVEKAFE